MDPPSLDVLKVQEAHKEGSSLLSRIPTLTPELLLSGITSIVRRSWSDALSNIWIVIEQVTALLWSKWLEKQQSETFQARMRQFNDTRTWTTALRQEILFQIGDIDSSTLEQLFAARQARNALAHNGKTPDSNILVLALAGLKGLMAPFADGREIKMFDIDFTASQVFTSTELAGKPVGEPKYWRHFPRYPREDKNMKIYLEKMEDIRSGRRPSSPQQRI